MTPVCLSCCRPDGTLKPTNLVGKCPFCRGVGRRLIGPHNGIELELMLANLKPAALITYPQSIVEFEPSIADGRFVVRTIADMRGQSWVITQPDQGWRALNLHGVYMNCRAKNRMDAKDHRAIGLLLGYTEESIQAFLDQPY